MSGKIRPGQKKEAKRPEESPNKDIKQVIRQGGQRNED
jgi:hypothetical protein